MTRKFLIFAANAAAPTTVAAGSVGAANALPAGLGEITEVGHADNWFQVSPFGSFPHSKGLQVFDQQAADSIVAMFNSARDRIARSWRGLPIFVGHPDYDRSTYPDSRKYGSVRALEVRADGLYAQPKWSNAGREMVNDEHFDFQSPLWLMEPIPGRPRAFRPVELVSIGLTNNPNIPGKPVGANTADTDLDPMKREDLIRKFNLKPAEGTSEVTDQQIDAAVDAALSASNERTTLTSQLSAANEAKTRAEREKADEATRAANERTARIDEKLVAAVSSGRITDAEKTGWRTRFETGFEAANTALQALPVKLNTRAANTGNLGERNGGAVAMTRDARITAANEAVDARLKETGNGDYAAAFAWVQKNKPDLFKDMQVPETQPAA